MVDKAASGVKSLRLGMDSIIGFAGFSTLVTALVGTLIEIPSSFSIIESQYAGFLALVAFALTLALSFLIINNQSYTISISHCAPLSVVAVVGALFAVLSLVPFCTQGVLGLLCIVGMALGVAALGSLWFFKLCTNASKTTLFYTTVGTCIGCVCVLAISFMVGYVSRIAVVGFYCLSCILSVVSVRTDEKAYFCDIEDEVSDKRARINKASTTMLAASFFEFGFLAGYVDEPVALTTCLGAGIVFALIVSIDAMHESKITERNLTPIMPPLTVFAFMLLFVDALDPIFNYIALAIISALTVIYISFGSTAMTKHIKLSKLSPLRIFSMARSIDYAGFFVGVCLGYAAIHLPGPQAALVGAAIAAFYCVISYMAHRSRFPEAGFEQAANRTVDGDQKTRRGWKQRCQAVGEAYDLSERQLEIMTIMSQGRDAKYIEKALTISLSTVQTHIRNIYRKVGVHSRQELLDLIENTKLYGDD